MKYYVEAYDHNGLQILGNLDGQGVIRCLNYARSKHYKALVSGAVKTLNNRVKYWNIVTLTDRIVAVVNNPNHVAHY